MVRSLLAAGAVLACCVVYCLAAEKDSPAAAATRKKLETKISVDYKDTRMEDIKKDLAEKIKDATDKDLSIQLDNPGGVSNNMTVSYSAKDKPLAEILDEMFKKNDMGYIVVSKEYKSYKGRYDGWILIVKGKERGYPAGQEPKNGDEPTVKKGKEKEKEKPKATKTEPGEKPTEDGDKAEQAAARKLGFAKDLLKDGKTTKAKERLGDIIKDFPKTKAAEEAQKILDDLKN